MTMTKKRRWGLIFFIILIIAAILVTKEPWKRSSAEMRGSLDTEAPPPVITIKWKDLATGYPRAHTGDTILSYTGFDLAFNEQFEQAAWVAYVLTREEIESGTIERTDNFRADKSIVSGSASPSDYRRSGFDRGHLAPAGDMKWDEEAMSQSFLMTNMSPQRPAFNRGIWRKLETETRNWAIEKDSLYVITGPLFSPADSTIGENEVAIPGYYFKVLVDLSPPDHDMIAFLLPNAGSSEELLSFAIPVDSLEKISAYDFFADAPEQEIIDWLEQSIAPGNWN